jgi:hypothetical protein
MNRAAAEGTRWSEV